MSDIQDNQQHGMIIENNDAPTIYADHIIGFAIGPAVSKLHLGMEIDKGVRKTSNTIVIPTAALIESLSFIQNSLRDNTIIQDELRKGIDAIKKQYSEL